MLNRKCILISVFFSIYIMIALKINLPSIYEEGSVFRHLFLSMEIQRVTDLMTAFGIFCLSVIALHISKSSAKVCIISSAAVAFFFAAFIPLGRVFRSYDGYWIIYANYVQIIKTCIVVTGYTLMLYLIIIILYRILDSISTKSIRRGFSFQDSSRKSRNKKNGTDTGSDPVADFVIRHRFVFLLILLGLSAIVFYILYPGFVMGDTKEQIKEAFGIRLYDDSYFNYLYPDSSLTNMRPVISTLYFKVCLIIGKTLFNSYTSGLGLFVLSQMIALNAAFWRICCLLAMKGTKGRYILFLLLYLYLNPLIATLSVTMVKDTVYMAFMLLFITEFYVIICGGARLPNYLTACAGALVSMAFKGDAFYTLVIVVIVYAVYSFAVKKPRAVRLFTVIFPISLILVHVIWGSILLPAMHVSPGKKNVQAAIPLQQVARYVIFHWDEVSEEDRAAIDAVVDYDRIYTDYSPTYADNMIVNTRNFSDEEFREFLKVWLRICAKDPGLALTAWLHNKYEYFYMEDTTFYYYGMELSNEAIGYLNEEGLELGGIDFNIHYPDNAVKGIREFIDNVWQSEESIPVWNIITLPALYMLLLIMITIYFFAVRNQNGKIFLLFPWTVFILTNAFSATNGHYSRYMYPVAVMIPVIFALFPAPEKKT